MNKHIESDLMLKALIFDVDGTLADTESVHLQAFNHAFADQGLDWHWDEALYTQLLEISGGKERMTHYWKQVHPNMKDIVGSGLTDTIEHLHALKTAAYESAVQSGAVKLRPGVLDIIHSAHQLGLRLAIATTTSPVNIAVLLRNAIGPDWKELFLVIEDASTAPKKKPHPQVYVQTLARLGLPSDQCLAIEDSSNGLRAAVTAGLKTIITQNRFTAHHDFSGALQVLPDLGGVSVEQLRTWHQK
jgi:HAD superfamily hydrolase (TIGR01509 family)